MQTVGNANKTPYDNCPECYVDEYIGRTIDHIKALKQRLPVKGCVACRKTV